MIALLISLLLANGLWVTEPLQARWRTHKGAYFEIKYPASFKAQRSLPSYSFEGEYDSAFFTSPDNAVEFYVFSPLWNGEPKDIEIDPATEEYVSQDKAQKKTIVIRRITIRAKDDSYRRSFEDTENTEHNTRKVFGIKYRDQGAYGKYRRDYLAFKKSLRQFSD